MPLTVFSENVTAITKTFTRMIHVSFAVTWLFFHIVAIIFNIVLPTLSETLCNIVVKFPASDPDHITNGTRKL